MNRLRQVFQRPLGIQRPIGLQQQQQPPDPQDPAGPLTQEQRDAISQMLNAAVNNTLTARLKSFEVQLHTKLGESFGKLLEDKLKDFKPAPADPPDDQGGKGGKGGKGGDNVELATLRTQMQAALTKMNQTEAKFAAERAKNRAISLRQVVSEKLSTLGIDGVRFKGAFAMLQSEGRIKHRDEDSDEIIFVDESGNEVDHNVGLEGWVKTDDAKIFLPPTGAKGAGGKPTNGVVKPAGPANRQEAQVLAFTELGKELQGVFGGMDGHIG